MCICLLLDSNEVLREKRQTVDTYEKVASHFATLWHRIC